VCMAGSLIRVCRVGMMRGSKRRRMRVILWMMIGMKRRCEWRVGMRGYVFIIIIVIIIITITLFIPGRIFFPLILLIITSRRWIRMTGQLRVRQIGSWYWVTTSIFITIFINGTKSSKSIFLWNYIKIKMF
jgi:hypothetical protein